MADPFSDYPLPTNLQDHVDIDHAEHINRVARAANDLQANATALAETVTDQGDTLVDQAAELAAVASGLAPIRVMKNDANLAFGIVANAWHDTDPTGSQNARPLDIVIPDVEAGDWISVTIAGLSATTAAGVYLDMFTVVAGAYVHQFGSATNGSAAWVLVASMSMVPSGTITYQVQANDIENGAVRCRLRDRNTTTTARGFAATGGLQFVLEGRGPF